MATNPIITEEPSPNWPSPGTAMSEEEFHEIERLDPDRRYEYIAGRAYKVGGGTVGHDRILRNISSALDRHLSGSCTTFGSEVQVLVGNKKNGKNHYVYPDATVSYNSEDSRRYNTLIKSPKVVFEVTGPNTEARDRGVKFRAYKKCPTIQAIVLVNQYAPHIDIWQRDEHDPEKWYYRHYGPGDTVVLASINAQVGIEELYRGVNFPVDEDEEDGE